MSTDCGCHLAVKLQEELFPLNLQHFWQFFIIFVRFTIFVILEDFRPILNLINIDNLFYFVDTHFCCFAFLSHFVDLATDRKKKARVELRPGMIRLMPRVRLEPRVE